MAGTYGVASAFEHPPVKGVRNHGVMRQRTGEVEQDGAATLKEIERLKAEGPSVDDGQQGRGELTPRPGEQHKHMKIVLEGSDARP